MPGWSQFDHYRWENSVAQDVEYETPTLPNMSENPAVEPSVEMGVEYAPKEAVQELAAALKSVEPFIPWRNEIQRKTFASLIQRWI